MEPHAGTTRAWATTGGQEQPNRERPNDPLQAAIDRLAALPELEYDLIDHKAKAEELGLDDVGILNRAVARARRAAEAEPRPRPRRQGKGRSRRPRLPRPQRRPPKQQAEAEAKAAKAEAKAREAEAKAAEKARKTAAGQGAPGCPEDAAAAARR